MIAPRRFAQRLYLDSSALVKLILPEPETGALRGMLRPWPRRLSSALAAVEVARAVRRFSGEATLARRAEEIVARVGLVAIADDILLRAASLEPATLRALDAIHLATALSLGRDLGGFVTYDDVLAAAAREAGLTVFRPR